MGTLKIRENSLLWRYYDNFLAGALGLRRDRLSLCGFAQRIFWGSLAIPVTLIVILWMAWSALYLPYACIHYGLRALFEEKNHPIHGIFAGLFIVGIFTWIGIALTGLYGLAEYMDTRVANKKTHQSDDTFLTPGNLFWTWLKAKKDQICPMIEVVREKDAASK